MTSSSIDHSWRAMALMLMLAAASLVHAAAAPEPYATMATSCDGLPRIDVDVAPGFCLGLVLAPAKGRYHQRAIRTPRMLLQLPDESRWLLSDLGGWTAGRGKVWELRFGPAGKLERRALASTLSLPHTLSYGPDGAVYVAEMHRISRLDTTSGRLTPVVEGLPTNELHVGRHPLSHFTFDSNGDLVVNVGADSDQCEDTSGTLTSCAEAEGPSARAVLRRYRYLGEGTWDPRPSIEARGLRNSLLLLRHESGTILQAENSYDFAPSRPTPHDELNVLRAGANFGWPYCFDLHSETPAWRDRTPLRCDSAEHEKPAALLPPHSAPLGGVYYNASLMPDLRGKLLLGLHGYFVTGSRVLAYDVDARGIPTTTQPLDLTPNWTLRHGRGPAGAPVALTVARDGSVWIADDRNAAVLRLSVDRP
jgi:glucose/arabinose dehydrogenase